MDSVTSNVCQRVPTATCTGSTLTKLWQVASGVSADLLCLKDFKRSLFVRRKNGKKSLPSVCAPGAVPLDGPASGEVVVVRQREPPFQVATALGTAESGEGASSGGASSLLPAVQGMVEPDMSADPSLGKARLVKELESQAGPPFRVVSVHETSEAGASSVVLSPPLEPFLYLSPYTSSLANPFPGVTSQDTMSSPCLSDSALQVASEQGPK